LKDLQAGARLIIGALEDNDDNDDTAMEIANGCYLSEVNWEPPKRQHVILGRRCC
jgi:hypothetical protein